MSNDTKHDGPRIYVASLADYNAGRLHGVWIDLGDGIDAADVHEAVQAMLAESREPVAEEWAIHDHEGFHGLSVSEWSDFAELCDLADLIAEYGEAFALFAGNVGQDYADRKGFEDAYQGVHESGRSFAMEYAEECCAFDFDVPWPLSCVDWDDAWRNLEGFYGIRGSEGFHVFYNI